MSIVKYAKHIADADLQASIKFLNWPYLDKRVENEFKKLAEFKDESLIFGKFYLTSSKNIEPYKSSRIPHSKINNFISINTGNKFLNFWQFDTKKKQLKLAREYNARLWYSQSPSGQVIVFLAPYSSSIGEIDEKEIIIGKYNKPGDITNKKIQKHFAKFFKYCSCTSCNNSHKLINYLYRRYLIFNDFRYRSSYLAIFLKILEKLLLLILGGAAVWATLYVGDKI